MIELIHYFINIIRSGLVGIIIWIRFVNCDRDLV